MLRLNGYPFLKRSGSIETKILRALNLANRSIHFWKEVAPLKPWIIRPWRIGGNSYPFLKRSGSIETFNIAADVRFINSAIHFWKEVAPLKPSTLVTSLQLDSSIHFWKEVAPLKPSGQPADALHPRLLSISEKKWLHWNAHVPQAEAHTWRMENRIYRH